MIIKIDASSKYLYHSAPEAVRRGSGSAQGTPWFYCEGDSIKIRAYLSSEDLELLDDMNVLPVPPEDGVWLTPPLENQRGGLTGATVVEVRKGTQETHIVFDGEAYILNDAGKTVDHIESVSQRMKVKRVE